VLRVEPQQLVEITRRYAGGETGSFSYPLFEFLRDGSSSRGALRSDRDAQA
jgi:hypothetical protein